MSSVRTPISLSAENEIQYTEQVLREEIEKLQRENARLEKDLNVLGQECEIYEQEACEYDDTIGKLEAKLEQSELENIESKKIFNVQSRYIKTHCDLIKPLQAKLESAMKVVDAAKGLDIRGEPHMSGEITYTIHSLFQKSIQGVGEALEQFNKGEADEQS